MRKQGRLLLLLTLFVGLSFGIFFGMASSATALPEYSPDGKTCTPCHEEGGPGGGTPAAPTPAAPTPAAPTPAAPTPAAPTPAAPTPAAPTPAEQKPAEQTPAEQKPAEQKPAEQTPAEQKPAVQTPAEQPAAEVHEEKAPTSPYIVIGIVAVILAVIYFVAIRRKH